MNTAMHLLRVGRAYGERPAVARGKSVLMSYAALADRAARLGASLAGKLALKPGDRVAIVLSNCPEYLEILYACWHAGLVAVPVNAKLHPTELAYILGNCGARVCFGEGSCVEQLSLVQGHSLEQVIPVSEDGYRSLLVGAAMEPVDRAPDAPAWLFYTSGTTGRPKGAVLSHRNLQSMCYCYLTDVNPGAPWRCVLHAAPMSHGSGLYGLAHVMQGSCHIIPEQQRFDPDEIFSLIGRWPGISFFAAPTMVKRLTEHPRDLSTNNLQTIVYGGGPMYLEDCRAALDRFGPKLAQLYGQGESPMTITALNAQAHANQDHPRWLQRLASVGIPQSAVEVRVADSDDRPLPAEEVGEVLVRGDTVMTGYWANPEATAETLRGGWLHTGDLAEFDPDGFLTLKDRS